MLFPQNPSDHSWRIPTSCFARPTHNTWEKTRNPTTIFLVLKLEESFWTENTKPLNFPSCCFSSKLLNWVFSCWQTQAVSPQSHLNTQQIGQGPDSWCGATPQQCRGNTTYYHPKSHAMCSESEACSFLQLNLFLEMYASDPVLGEKQEAPVSPQFKANSRRKPSASTSEKARLLIQFPGFRHWRLTVWS